MFVNPIYSPFFINIQLFKMGNPKIKDLKPKTKKKNTVEIIAYDVFDLIDDIPAGFINKFEKRGKIIEKDLGLIKKDLNI